MSLKLSELDPEVLANPAAVLATNGPGGKPQMTAIWFVIEDEQFCITATDRTQKVKNLLRDPNCGVLIFHPDSVGYFIEIRGTATLTDDNDMTFAQRVGIKYDADMSGYQTDDANRYKIAITPTKINVADWRG